mgnify:CR=1 FL=1
MANINVKTRRKQVVVLIAVLCGLGVTGGVAWYLGQPVKPAAKAAPKPAPNMTGVVSSSFDKKLEGAAVANLQETASEADKKIRGLVRPHRQTGAEQQSLPRQNRAAGKGFVCTAGAADRAAE